MDQKYNNKQLENNFKSVNISINVWINLKKRTNKEENNIRKRLSMIGTIG